MKYLKTLTLLFTVSLPYALCRNEGSMFADGYADCKELFNNFDATLKFHYLDEGDYARGKPFAPKSD